MVILCRDLQSSKELVTMKFILRSNKSIIRNNKTAHYSSLEQVNPFDTIGVSATPSPPGSYLGSGDPQESY